MDSQKGAAGWKVVAGSGVGIAFGSLPCFAAGFALLAGAIAHQHGWSQPDMARAATIFLLMQTIAYPLCGGPLDRWGSRRFAAASIALFAASLLGLSLIGPSLLQLYAAFAVLGLLSAGTNVVSYARAISQWFNARRGLALGAASSAQALGSFLVPVLAQAGIAAYGWPASLRMLAAFEVLVCLPLVWLLVRDRPTVRVASDAASNSGADVLPRADEPRADGLRFGEVVRSATFWKLAIGFAIMGMSFYAIAPNIVYILTRGAGMSTAEVARIQAATGVAVLFGRIGFGFLLDRMHAPWVAVLALLLTAICAAVYATSASPALIVAAAVAAGLSVGGETDLMPYLASRYFGVEAVAKIFGWFLFAFFLGAAVGPIAFAQASAAYGGGRVPLLALAALQIVPALLFLTLGRYPAAGGVPAAGEVRSARSGHPV